MLTENQTGVRWALVKSLLLGADRSQINPQTDAHFNAVAQVAMFFITGVHLGTKAGGVQDALEGAGMFFGDDGVRWKNHQLYSEEDWIEGWRQEFNDPQKEKVAYEDLLLWGRTDRRLTLRLPPGTHASLARVARGRGLSLNQIIVDVLEDWRERDGGADTPSAYLDPQAAYARLAKHYRIYVTQLLAHPVYFVELWPLVRPLTPPSRAGVQPPRANPVVPKAIVEVRDGRSALVGWERPVTSGRLGDAELKMAVEEAVDRFISPHP